MGPQLGGSSQTRRRATIAAWIALPVIVAAFIRLSYWPSGIRDEVAAQLVYLVAPILGAAFSASAAWLATRHTRSKAVWTLLATAITLMLVSETYFSWTQVTGAPVSMRDGVFDAINAVAFLVLVGTLSVAAGIDRLGPYRAVRIVLDVSAITTVALLVMFHVWTSGIGGAVDSIEGVRMAAYSVAGLLVFVLTGYLVATMPPRLRARSWALHLAGGLVVYSIALMLWPWWSLALNGVSPASPAVEAVMNTLFLTGYYMVFISGLARVLDAGEPWSRIMSRTRPDPSAWPGVAVSGGVLLAVLVLGWASWGDTDPPMEEAVHLVSLIVATVCMVGRTALTSFESDAVRYLAVSDTATGVANPRRFETRLAHDVSVARRFGDRSALFLIDVDDFAAVNLEQGRESGDRVLGQVAAALRKVAPQRSEVFRLSSDEFAVIAQVEDRSRAQILAEQLLGAVRSVSAAERAITASVGYAVCPDDARDSASLVRYADVAVLWAKRHGKARVAGYDHRVAHAVGTASPERAVESDDVAIDVARALIAASDARETGNHRHSRNVAALSCLLAGDLPGDNVDLERLRLAATLHDVGKIGLPSTKSGAAGARSTEALAARAHCELGARMLRSAHLDDMALWVYHHHERWDGSGFPEGLRGEGIPFEARIIAIADAYEKLTDSARPGGPLSRAAALQEIDQGIASRFDPGLAERFIKVIGSTAGLGWSDEWPAA